MHVLVWMYCLAPRDGCMCRAYPQFKGFVCKRSKRCKTCQHNLIKPELSPSSIKFKMQFISMYACVGACVCTCIATNALVCHDSTHVPQLRVLKPPMFKLGQVHMHALMT